MAAKTKITVGYIFSTIGLVIGIPSALFWGIGFFAGFAGYAPDPVSFFIVCTIFFLCSVLLVIGGIRMLRMLKTCSYYSDILSTQKVDSIYQLAGIVGRSEDMVRKELSGLISKGYLRGIYIDQHTWKIVPVSAPRNAVTAPPVVNVKCPNCGGSNELYQGSSGRCAYCDSVIRS